MAPLQSFTGIGTIMLATSCSAFVVPGPTQTSLRSTPAFAPASASATPALLGSRNLRVRATGLSFSTQPHANDGDRRGARLVYPGRQTAAGALKAASGVGGEEGGDGNDLTAARRALLLAIWLPFTAYAFGPWSPGSVGDPKDFEIITHLYDAAAPPNAVFVNLFNALGFFPGMMASMLVGGGSFQKGRQPVPALPFVFGAFALGFFSVGPYLALRNYLPEREEGEEMSTLEKILTSKVFAVPIVGLSAYTLVGLISSLTDPAAVATFPELFWSSKAAHISTLDFCVLNVAIIDPIREDMRRRGTEPELAKLALFSLPLIGPALWMLVRPPVEI
eukprot:g13171.t1